MEANAIANDKKLLAEVFQELLKTALSAEVTAEGPFANLYFRPMRFAHMGSIVKGHSHNYDHVTYLTKGSLHARAYAVDENGTPQGDMIERDYKAPARIFIQASMWHEFISLEDDTYAECIFVLRDKDGQPSDFSTHLPASYV